MVLRVAALERLELDYTGAGALFTIVDVTVSRSRGCHLIERRLSFHLIHGIHEQRFNPACVHTRSIRSCRGRRVSEPEGTERFSCTLKGSNRPTRDTRRTSADCRSEDRSPAHQTAEYHPGKERRVHPLEIAKVGKPCAMFSVAHVRDVILRMSGWF